MAGLLRKGHPNGVDDAALGADEDEVVGAVERRRADLRVDSSSTDFVFGGRDETSIW
jgi:hypothetical protein